MAVDLQHLLLTRLAVRLTDGASIPTDDWLRARLDLFAKYCAPSVNAQTEKGFRWLLLLDENIPLWVDNAARALVTQDSQIVRMSVPWSRYKFADQEGLWAGRHRLITS